MINKRILNKLIYSANRKNNRENIKIKEQFVPFFIIFVSICYFVLVGGLKKGIKNQLESATVTLQLIHQSEECPENISKIIYNQIGALVFCNEELDKLYECLNLLDSLIAFSKIVA